MNRDYAIGLGEKLVRYFERLAEKSPEDWAWEVRVSRAYATAVATRPLNFQALEVLDIELAQKVEDPDTATGIIELHLAIKRLLRDANS